MAANEHEFWNGRYSTDHYVFGMDAAQFLREHVHSLKPGSRVLVPADGEGRNSVFLAQHGYEVVATDFAEAALQKARQLAASKSVQVDFRHADLQHLEWPDAEYDAVVAIFIQFAPPAFRDQIFAGMKKALKPGGVLMLHGYTPKQLEYGTGGPSALEQLYTPELLATAFADWEILRLEAYERELDEGEGHKGMSAVIDLIAKMHSHH